MDDYRLTTGQIASLKALHRTLRDKRLADRVKAVVLLGTGWTPQQVAEVLFLDEKTIRSYFAHYLETGEKGLVRLHYQGKSPSLPVEQQEELVRHLDETTYIHSGEIRRHVLKTYGVNDSPTGIKGLLQRLGFPYR